MLFRYKFFTLHTRSVFIFDNCESNLDKCAFVRILAKFFCMCRLILKFIIYIDKEGSND